MDNGTKNQDRSEKSLHELLDSPTVDIYVGEENTRWPLPEKLLCYHSQIFAEAFEKDSKDDKKKSYTLDDEEDATFRLLIGYFYSQSLPPVFAEKTVGSLLDLYLLALKLQIDELATAVVDSVREWYHKSSTYPGLRRVQYIYSNTDEDNEMREMMVSSVARLLTTGESIAAHWATALQRNGQLAVDIIRSIQHWHLDEKTVPDVRDSSTGRDRKTKGGFSAVEREGTDSADTTMADSAIGMESNDEEQVEEQTEEQTKGKAGTGNMEHMQEVAAEADHSSLLILPQAQSDISQSEPTSISTSASTSTPEAAAGGAARTGAAAEKEDHDRSLGNTKQPQQQQNQQQSKRRTSSTVTFSTVNEIVPFPIFPDSIDERYEPEDVEEMAVITQEQEEQTQHKQLQTQENQESSQRFVKILRSIYKSQEAGLVILLWLVYVGYMFDVFSSSKRQMLSTSWDGIVGETLRRPANSSLQLGRFGMDGWVI